MGMLDALSTSTSGLSAQATALQNISGNIANSTTTGYKRLETAFADLIPDRNQLSSYAGGVGTSARQTTSVAGQIKTTQVPTNMALSGTGFFVVAKNTGSETAPSFAAQQLYTRRGDFAPDRNGYLTNGAGYFLVGGASGTASAPIQVPTAPLSSGATLTGVSVDKNGGLTGSYSDGQAKPLGQVAVAHFVSEGGLNSEDGEAYLATAFSGQPTIGLNGTTIQGGAIESSNTDISDQFSKMILTQQAYQSNAKVLSAVNDMMQDTIKLVA